MNLMIIELMENLYTYIYSYPNEIADIHIFIHYIRNSILY